MCEIGMKQIGKKRCAKSTLPVDSCRKSDYAPSGSRVGYGGFHNFEAVPALYDEFFGMLKLIL